MPFAGYPDFPSCVRANQDKRDPEAYCGYIKHKVEDQKDIFSPQELIKKIHDLQKQNPTTHLRDILKEVFQEPQEDFVLVNVIDLDESKGRWVTIRGRHVFVQKGRKILFHRNGSYESVTHREYAKKKEEKTQKIIEHMGYSREQGEEEYAKERKRRKEEARYKNLTKEQKKKEREEKNTQKEQARHETISKKKTSIQSSLSELTRLSKQHPGLNAILGIINKALKEGELSASNIGSHIQKFQRQKTSNQAQKEKVVKRLQKLHSQLKKLENDLTEDSFDELLDWIHSKGLASNEEEVYEIAFKILNSRKKKGQEKGSEKEWEQEWNEVGKEFEKRRSSRKEKQQEIEKAKKQQGLKQVKLLKAHDLTEDGIRSLLSRGASALFNRRTGGMIEGEEYFPSDEELTRFQPVDSSNIMSGALLGKYLVMNFLSKPRKAYKFNFGSEMAASKAFDSFMNASSKGKWQWQFIRGHVKGEKVTKEKIGPSLEKGLPTIGGTTASLKPYEIATTSLVEQELKSTRNIKRNEQLAKERKKIHAELIKSKKKGTLTSAEKELLKARGVRELQYGLGSDLIPLEHALQETSLLHDEIWMEDFHFITHDLQDDFSVLQGPITRAGAFPYRIGNQNVILYKQWANLKDIFSSRSYLPLIGSKQKGAHDSQDVLGFAYNFQFNEQDQQVLADIITLDDIHLLTDNFIPEKGWEVSIGFRDRRIGDKQIIDDVDHLAISLLNLEKGRCGVLGKRCYLELKAPFPSYHDQNQITEVILS